MSSDEESDDEGNLKIWMGHSKHKVGLAFSIFSPWTSLVPVSNCWNYHNTELGTHFSILICKRFFIWFWWLKWCQYNFQDKQIHKYISSRYKSFLKDLKLCFAFFGLWHVGTSYTFVNFIFRSKSYWPGYGEQAVFWRRKWFWR